MIMCDEALKLDPRYAKAWENKIDALFKLGKRVEAFYNRGRYEETCTGRYDKAITAYDEVLRLDPKCAGAWYNKANVLSKLGRYEEAIKRLR